MELRKNQKIWGKIFLGSALISNLCGLLGYLPVEISSYLGVFSNSFAIMYLTGLIE